MKKNFTLTLLIAAAMIGFSMSASAQDDASAFVGTEATVVKPIAITGVDALNFGVIVGTASGGTVTVSTGGVRTSSVTDLIMETGAQTGTVSAASFKVTGQDGYTYSITLPDPATGSFDVSNSDTTPATMLVSDFLSAPDAAGTLGTVTAGEQIVTVGATLNVGTNQASGVYTNANGLAITVQYN